MSSLAAMLIMHFAETYTLQPENILHTAVIESIQEVVPTFSTETAVATLKLWNPSIKKRFVLKTSFHSRSATPSPAHSYPKEIPDLLIRLAQAQRQTIAEVTSILSQMQEATTQQAEMLRLQHECAALQLENAQQQKATSTFSWQLVHLKKALQLSMPFMSHLRRARERQVVGKLAPRVCHKLSVVYQNRGALGPQLCALWLDGSWDPCCTGTGTMYLTKYRRSSEYCFAV